MAKGYRPVDRDQQFLIPPDMREWLSPTHPVWTLIEIVDRHLDTSVFHAGRRTGGVGRAGYNPDMLLTLLIWAWSKGMRSSRQIESACTDVVSYRVICAGDAPDHATISRFRKDNHGACEELFTQVLTVAARVGLGSLGTIALDGVKIASNASINANRSAEGLRAAADAEAAQARARRIAAAAVQAHADVDAAEDELYGEDDPGPGQVPEELADPTSRAKRIAEALAQIKAEEQARESARNAAAEGHLEQLDAGRFPVGRVPVAARVDAARTRLAREIARREVVETRYRQRAAPRRRAAGRRRARFRFRPRSIIVSSLHARRWRRRPPSRLPVSTRLHRCCAATSPIRSLDATTAWRRVGAGLQLPSLHRRGRHHHRHRCRYQFR
ncbi:transposase [Rhodococcus sovatensis]|uniref:transposase n=1 Tax=Rhodococcus sovatensis TaxID=1805840 RepID=UPI003BB0599E